MPNASLFYLDVKNKLRVAGRVDETILVGKLLVFAPLSDELEFWKRGNFKFGDVYLLLVLAIILDEGSLGTDGTTFNIKNWGGE
jgi:hypothetical protein